MSESLNHGLFTETLSSRDDVERRKAQIQSQQHESMVTRVKELPWKLLTTNTSYWKVEFIPSSTFITHSTKQALDSLSSLPILFVWKSFESCRIFKELRSAWTESECSEDYLDATTTTFSCTPSYNEPARSEDNVSLFSTSSDSFCTFPTFCFAFFCSSSILFKNSFPFEAQSTPVSFRDLPTMNNSTV